MIGGFIMWGNEWELLVLSKIVRACAFMGSNVCVDVKSVRVTSKRLLIIADFLTIIEKLVDANKNNICICICVYYY